MAENKKHSYAEYFVASIIRLRCAKWIEVKKCFLERICPVDPAQNLQDLRQSDIELLLKSVSGMQNFTSNSTGGGTLYWQVESLSSLPKNFIELAKSFYELDERMYQDYCNTLLSKGFLDFPPISDHKADFDRI